MLRGDNRPKFFRTLALICESESLSDAQLKAYQTRLQFAILYPNESNIEGEVAVLKTHTTVPDEFLDSEKPIRSDWPSVYVSECFVEGERAKLHGSARPLRSFLPPSVVFRNAADIDDDVPEPELPSSSVLGPESGLEIVSTNQGLAIRKTRDRDSEIECIPIDEYYYGRQEGTSNYVEEKAEFRFKCAVCQRMFYSNIKLMHHIMGHVDEGIQVLLGCALNQCRACNRTLANAFCLRAHLEKDHGGATIVETPKVEGEEAGGQVEVVGFSCRICGKEAASDLALAHHLQSTHRQREMPYVCRICLFRSSLYEDILDHFKKAHNGSNHLLCTYCLRIFTPSDARVPGIPLMSPGGGGGAVSTAGLGAGVGQTQVYLQHLRMHQVQHQLRRCPTCRLNFTNKSDYQVHRRLDHKACTSSSGSSAAAAEQQMKQQQEETAQEQPSQGVEEFMTNTIETAQEAEKQPSPLVFQPQAEAKTTDQPQEPDATEAPATTAEDEEEEEEENHVILLNAPEPSRTKDLSETKLPPETAQLSCLECGESLSSVDHKQYLPCSACVFATCCAAGFARHVHRAHIYAPGSVLTDSHTGSPMIRPVAFEWMYNHATSVAPAEAQPSQAACIEPMDQSGPDGEQPVQAEALAVESTAAEVTPDEQPARDEAKQEQTPTVPADTSGLGGVDGLFACPRCALSGVDGNTLARHLIEDCEADCATLQPDPEIVAARRQAEEQMRLQQEQEAAYGAGVVQGDDAGQVVYQLQPGPDEAASDVLHAPEEQQVAALGEAGGLPATIDITDPAGEVVQRLVIPEDLHLEPGQTLILIQGEDGQPQLAVINQADWDANNQQLAMQTDDDTSNLLLYGNAEGDVAVPEEEKENQL
uniref:C2H2-type domain-containing protein n=1 Tax=Mesocestoides corti TaxID=53468 RepID=A0A5K3FF07_MESCO